MNAKQLQTGLLLLGIGTFISSYYVSENKKAVQRKQIGAGLIGVAGILWATKI